MTENEKILAAWIAENSHSCPFGDDAGFSLQGCKGFGSEGCAGCILGHISCLDPGRPVTDKYGNDLKGLKPGDYVLYQNGSQFELGRVKSIDKVNRTASVFYTLGETASRTSFSDLVVLKNSFVINETGLGGERAGHIFDGKDNGSYDEEGFYE